MKKRGDKKKDKGGKRGEHPGMSIQHFSFDPVSAQLKKNSGYGSDLKSKWRKKYITDYWLAYKVLFIIYIPFSSHLNRLRGKPSSFFFFTSLFLQWNGKVLECQNFRSQAHPWTYLSLTSVNYSLKNISLSFMNIFYF